MRKITGILNFTVEFGEEHVQVQKHCCMKLREDISPYEVRWLGYNYSKRSQSLSILGGTANDHVRFRHRPKHSSAAFINNELSFLAIENFQTINWLHFVPGKSPEPKVQLLNVLFQLKKVIHRTEEGSSGNLQNLRGTACFSQRQPTLFKHNWNYSKLRKAEVVRRLNNGRDGLTKASYGDSTWCGTWFHILVAQTTTYDKDLSRLVVLNFVYF